MLLRFWPVLLVAVLLPEPFNLAMPVSGVAFACFLFTLVMGCVLVVAYLMLVLICTIYTLNPMGIRLIAVSMTEFLTGALIPLPFLPEGLQRFLELSPFGSMQNLPLRIYCGDIAGTEMWQAMGLQLFWIVVLIGIVLCADHACGGKGGAAVAVDKFNGVDKVFVQPAFHPVFHPCGNVPYGL